MKSLIAILVLAGFAARCGAEEMPEEVFRKVSKDKTRWVANAKGAKAKECLRVVDQDGAPVAGAKVWGGLQTGSGYNDFVPIRGTTDTNGEFVIQGKCTSRIRCDITKDGYYRSEFLMTDYGHRHGVKEGKWQPYGEMNNVVLKKIINPQSLICHDASASFKVPAYDKWLGFDFEKFDFVAPNGKGSHGDVLLRFALKQASIDDYHMTMELSFTNNPYAGAYEMSRTKMSEQESVYLADTNAVYRQMISYQFDECPDKMPVYTRQLTSDKYLVFRTRTKVDAFGRLMSAHYGKIYGALNFVGPGGMSMERLVFNPTPNDTNLEDLETAERSRRDYRHQQEMRRNRQ